MNMKKVLGAAAVVGAATFAGSGTAATITNTDGSFSFTGFDWAQGATAVVSGFAPVADDAFSLTYFGWGTAINNTPSTFVPASMDIDANGAVDAGKAYEYTVVASLSETVVGCTSGGTCTFQIVSGTFSIYYDTTPDANAVAGGLGTGFTDGTLIISGNFGAQPGGSFTNFGTGGFGITGLLGTVAFTNATYINPALVGTTVVTTLQIGDYTTNWVDPGGFNGTAFTQDQIILQADANQNFSQVPEPATLALLGLGAAFAGFASRRQKRGM